MLYNSSLNPVGLIGKEERDKKAVFCFDAMAAAMVEVWRKGECRLVRETFKGVRDDKNRKTLQEKTSALLLPTERSCFNQCIGQGD